MGRGGYNGGPSIALGPKEDEGSEGGLEVEVQRSTPNGTEDNQRKSVLTASSAHLPPDDVIVQIQNEKTEVEVNPFLRDLDAKSYAYFSLLRQYGRRRNQGRDVQYRGFLKAMSAQGATEEAFCRVSVIEFSNDRSNPISFDSSDMLRTYIDKDPQIVATEQNSPSGTRRLFILEDLAVKYVCLLGSRLRIHPSVFASHYSTDEGYGSLGMFPSINHFLTTDGLDYDSLLDCASSVNEIEKRRFTLRYPIVMPRLSAVHDSDPRLCPPWLKPTDRLTDQNAYPRFNVERNLETPTSNDIWDEKGKVATMQGQVTYWSRRNTEGGWDAMLLVDPCIKDPAFLAMLKGAQWPNLHRIIRYPDLEDKVDISEDPFEWSPSASFTKYVLYDDLLQHFELSDTDPGHTPIALTPFIRGFVISKWMAYFNHVHRCFLATRARQFTDGNPKTTQGWQYSPRWGGDWTEWMFERMTRWITDLQLDITDIEANMWALGMNPEDPQSYGMVGKREGQMWRYGRTMLLRHREMFSSITNSYTQVMALRETQTSNLQARSVGRLTLLGTLFVPASIISSMLSMGGDFLPGKGKFWIYWVITIPVLTIIAIGLFTDLLPWLYSLGIWRIARRQNKETEMKVDSKV